MTPLKLKKPLLKRQSQIDLSIEQSLHSEGYQRVVGVDEAGRGPLAGPVVAAACLVKQSTCLMGINDSKQLTAIQRERLFSYILEHCECAVGVVSHREIDEMNILQATHRAMRLAIQNLFHLPDYILVDGPIVGFEGIPSKGLIGGDAICQSIAAASIVAKVTRDRMMQYYHASYPHYGYAKHKGYPTAAHKQMVRQCGPSPIQRMTFNY